MTRAALDLDALAVRRHFSVISAGSPETWCPSESEQGIVAITVSERDALVALARQGPTPTCQTCRFWKGKPDQTWDDTCENTIVRGMVWVQVFGDATVDKTVETAPTFGCTLHEPLPAPPEGR